MRGGSSNAFTASTYTNFHFDLPKEHFLDALDRWRECVGRKASHLVYFRFVSFFICPVFHEKTVESEVRQA
jgi:secreted Zn-dependent insulinase-like peptidase